MKPFAIVLGAAAVLGLGWLAFSPPAAAKEKSGDGRGSGPTGAAPFDEPAFDRFIATRPTPTEFRARHPQILLIEPGMASTRERRSDNSRFFATIDETGRIIGGKFS